MLFLTPQKERLEHTKLLKGASFKLHNHPLDYFEANPFKQEKCTLIYTAKFIIELHYTHSPAII